MNADLLIGFAFGVLVGLVLPQIYNMYTPPCKMPADLEMTAEQAREYFSRRPPQKETPLFDLDAALVELRINMPAGIFQD